MADMSKIYELARKFNLSNIANGAVDLKIEKEMSNLDYLEYVLSAEYELRTLTVRARREKESKLPNKEFMKSHVNSGIAWQIEQLEELRWLEEAENILLVGKCDSGKTSLASHLGRKALDAGAKVAYMPISKFIETVEKKDSYHSAEKHFQFLCRSSLIILDDVMYVRIPDNKMAKVYHALNFLNESRSIMIITNRELSQWAEGSEDPHLINTLLARLQAGSQTIRL